jgi:IS30 family transposase
MPDIPYEIYMKELLKIKDWNKKLKRLDEQEKKFILQAANSGASIVSIAKVLKRHKTTIYNFLNENR